MVLAHENADCRLPTHTEKKEDNYGTPFCLLMRRNAPRTYCIDNNSLGSNSILGEHLKVNIDKFGFGRRSKQKLWDCLGSIPRLFLHIFLYKGRFSRGNCLFGRTMRAFCRNYGLGTRSKGFLRPSGFRTGSSSQRIIVDTVTHHELLSILNPRRHSKKDTAEVDRLLAACADNGRDVCPFCQTEVHTYTARVCMSTCSGLELCFFWSASFYEIAMVWPLCEATSVWVHTHAHSP